VTQSNVKETGTQSAHHMTEALTDIAELSHRLVEQQIQRIQTDDGYQVVDARTVSKTFQDLAIKAIKNPGVLSKSRSNSGRI
jgi:hypothetical protein